MAGISEELRRAVLQAAIQGKLTQQLPEDGNAETLLSQIKEKKEILIREKKIKREKAFSPISEAEIPFEIPDNWSWCVLTDVGNFSSGKTPDMTNKDYWENGTINWTTSKDMKNRYLSESQLKISKKAAETMRLYPAGTLLMVVRSGILKRALPLCILTQASTINQDLKAFDIFMPQMSKYLYYALKGLEPDILLNYTKRVTTVDSLKFDEFSQQMPVPLPPLSEQHRIVARVEKLMTKIDELEAIEKELTALRAEFPGDMKTALLQAAMQGKLTEQLPEDGDTETLLVRIKEKTKLLIKEKKMKKKKNIVPISEEDIPFDIPANWKWVRFAEIVRYDIGKTPPRKEPEWWKEDFPWVSIADMPANGHLTRTKEKVSKKALNIKFGNISKAGTLIMSFKLTVGRVSILDVDAVHNEAIISIYPIVDINEHLRDYLFKILPIVVQFGESKNSIKGRTLNDNSISNLMIPLPPFAEQQRIVEKLDEILPLCEALESVL